MSEQVYRLKPDAERGLKELCERLKFLHKLGRISADSALQAYGDAVRQLRSNPLAMEVDDREWSPIRCRNCGNTTSVVKGTTKYSCRCTPTVAREAFMDMVGRDGSYLVDSHVVNAKADKMAARAKALKEGATLSEADSLL